MALYLMIKNKKNCKKDFKTKKKKKKYLQEHMPETN